VRRITGKYVLAYMAGLARSWNPPITRKFVIDVQYLSEKENTCTLVVKYKLVLQSFQTST
jgi:hypothetical protein